MEPTPQTEGPSRRSVLSRAAAVAAGTAFASSALAQQSASPPSDAHSQNEANKTPTDPFPKNPELDQMFPSSFNPPYSDAGDVTTFKYPFSLGHNRVESAGWARQVTARDLVLSKDIAGVNMRLEPFGIRELHWHVAGEWAFMLQGNARVTAVDSDGHASVDDVSPGDLWFFPGGVPHSIQADAGGCEFLLVFDDGNFSEFNTFLITDWLHHTPPEVVAKHLDVDEKALKSIPPKDLYIFTGSPLQSLDADRKRALGPEGPPKIPFIFHMMQQKPDFDRKGGQIRIVDSKKFNISTSVASAHVRLRPGAIRELHWHPNADEWQFFIKGRGRQTVFTGGAKARTMDFHAGDVGVIQRSLPHYIQNTGDADLEFLEMFKSDFYQDLSLNQWVSRLSPQLVADHLKMDGSVFANLPKEKAGILPV